MYEISYQEAGQEFPTLEAFEEFEDAVKRAEEVETEVIYSGFDEYAKCVFCGEWEATYTMNKDGFCKRCVMAIWSRGEDV